MAEKADVEQLNDILQGMSSLGQIFLGSYLVKVVILLFHYIIFA